MKKIVLLILSAIITMGLTACSTKEEKSDNVQIPNPFIACDTINEAAEKVGFDISVPDSMEGYEERQIFVTEDGMIEIIYQDSESKIQIRKMAGSEDISGDYNQYKEVKTIMVDDKNVTMKGNDGKISTAIWSKDGYTFSVYSSKALSENDITALVQSIQ